MKKVILITLIVILSIVLALSLVTVSMLQGKIFNNSSFKEPVTYTVTFQVGDTVLEQQTVVGNQFPAALTAQLPGVELLGWVDSSNLAADPFAIPATTDVTYQALFYPQLTNHVPYLFANEEGQLLPDESLTHADLALALNALAAEGAAAYFPALSEEATAVAHADLVEILAYFYPAEDIAAAFPEPQAPTRSHFAAGMNQLLGRTADEQVSLSEGSALPADITADRADAAALLEASAEHTPAADGILWSSLPLPTPYEPGFINLEGQLYYVQEDHYFLKDGYVGTLYFDPDGRYTSGDATLDATVVSILKEMVAQNPEADRFELLRIVYDHCHQNYTYRRTFDHPEYGSTGWEIQRANAMFETTKGNCYSYAAIFWALSRGLGYETRAISGKVLEDEQPHSWCIIQLEDGADYIFDPQWQYNYTERGITHHDMFKIPMERIGYWLYQWTE